MALDSGALGLLGDDGCEVHNTDTVPYTMRTVCLYRVADLLHSKSHRTSSMQSWSGSRRSGGGCPFMLQSAKKPEGNATTLQSTVIQRMHTRQMLSKGAGPSLTARLMYPRSPCSATLSCRTPWAGEATPAMTVKCPFQCIDDDDTPGLEQYLQNGGDILRANAQSWTLLYAAARANRVALARLLLQNGAAAALFAPEQTGSVPLHAAAHRGTGAMVTLLLDHHQANARSFDPRTLRNKFGESPMDVAGLNADPTCREAFAVYLACHDMNPDAATAAQPPPVRTFNTNFVRAVALSPLIGDRNAPLDFAKLDLAAVTDGIVQEERAFLAGAAPYGRWQELRAQWMGTDLQEQGEEFWKCHMSGHRIVALLRQAHAEGEVALCREVVFLYTIETFLYKSVNFAMRNLDESRTHLVPFIRLLNHALRVQRRTAPFTAPAYRCLTLPAELQQKYVPTADTKRNLCSFDGFTSLSALPAKAFSILQEWDCNTLFVVTPSDPDNLKCCPVDISGLSAYPEEREV